MSPFKSPSAGGDQLAPADVLNRLLIVKPTRYREGISTQYGESDAIQCDVVDLDDIVVDTGQPQQYRGVLWFQRVLIAGLKDEIGGLVLARMGKGTAKPGQSAPWILNDATGDQAAVAKASAWLEANPGFEATQQPATPAAPVTPPVAPAPQPAATAAVQGFNAATGEMTPELAAALAQLQAQQQAS
jgi:hypothetical protein